MSDKTAALEIVNHVNEVIKNTENNGITRVDISGLKLFFGDLTKRINDGYPDDETIVSYENQKLEWERQMKQWEADVTLHRTSYQERLNSTVELARLTLKSSILINGGAAVATLALLGQVWSPYLVNDLLFKLANGVKYFAYGVLLAGVSVAFGYLCEGAGLNETTKGNKWMMFFGIVAILLIVCSYVLFGLGVNTIYTAFTIPGKLND